MHHDHDRLTAERTADHVLRGTCSCGDWEGSGPTAERLGEQWDAHRRSTGADAPPLCA